jgi:sporulation protein YlmC with PRC-barrel domain
MPDITEDNLTGKNNEALFANTPLQYLSASSIIGDKVHNNDNEHLGSIKDIMLNIKTGNIEYYIIEFGGFLGIGIKYFAIPFRLLKVDAENKSFIFEQSKEVLRKAPGFDIEHWPETNIHLDEMYGYWNFMGQ